MKLRHLVWMAEGEIRERWIHTAHLRADICSQWRKSPVSPMKFLPKWIRRTIKRPKEPKPASKNIFILKTLFVDNQDWANK